MNNQYWYLEGKDVILRMDVSLLLKQLDSLNEENQRIQMEIRTVNNNLGGLLYEEEKTNATITTLTKKINDTIPEDKDSIIGMGIEMEYLLYELHSI